MVSNTQGHTMSCHLFSKAGSKEGLGLKESSDVLFKFLYQGNVERASPCHSWYLAAALLEHS